MKRAPQTNRAGRLALVAIAALVIAGCASASFHASPAPTLAPQATWVVAPLVNNTATPYAGDRAARLVSTLLAQRTGSQVLVPPAPSDATGLPLDNGEAAETNARSYAGKHGAQYLVEGSVDEWNYKIGLDGQPAVGFTLSVIDLATGKTIWTAAASATGGSREGVAVLAQDTLSGMLGKLTGT